MKVNFNQEDPSVYFKNEDDQNMDEADDDDSTPRAGPNPQSFIMDNQHKSIYDDQAQAKQRSPQKDKKKKDKKER